MRIYVASSWRNPYQPSVVSSLRSAGHAVYDFRNPAPGQRGFSWSEIDPDWAAWKVSDFLGALDHEYARRAFSRDQEALEWCDTCVLVLPSGMSAHLEAGWCAGQGKQVVVLAGELQEAELMYKLFDEDGRTPIYSTLDELISALRDRELRGHG